MFRAQMKTCARNAGIFPGLEMQRFDTQLPAGQRRSGLPPWPRNADPREENVGEV
jgi:hypothetical protein